MPQVSWRVQVQPACSHLRWKSLAAAIAKFA